MGIAKSGLTPMWGKTGDKNCNWKGGHKNNLNFYYQTDWAKLSIEIYKRDNMSCKKCQDAQKNGMSAYFRIGIANIELRGCHIHLKECITMLRGMTSVKTAIDCEIDCIKSGDSLSNTEKEIALKVLENIHKRIFNS